MPAEEGKRIGNQHAKTMNKSLLAKLAWRMLLDHTSLWTRVLQSKYPVKDVHDQTWTIVKSN